MFLKLLPDGWELERYNLAEGGLAIMSHSNRGLIAL